MKHSGFDFFDKLLKNIKKFESHVDDTVVRDGKFIGPDVGVEDNMVQGTTVSDNSKDAKHQRMFEESLTGQIKDEITDEEMEAMADRYVDAMIDKLYKDL